MTTQGYRIKEMAELSGLSDHVIRMWERRYELLRPRRTDNGYRLYTEDDLQLLLYLKSQIDSGRSIGELARDGLEKLREHMTHTPVTLPEVPEGLRQQALAIIHSARCSDQRTTAERIHRTVTLLGIERAVIQVLFPVLRVVGELWHRGEIGNQGEQAITRTVRQELVQALTSQRGTGPLAVVACTPKEFHEIGAMTAALLLQQIGWQVIYLGPDTGIEVLRLACKRRRANLVVLSCTFELKEREMRKLLERLRTRIAPLCPVSLGGKGASAFASVLDGRGFSVLADINQVRRLTPESFGLTGVTAAKPGGSMPPGGNRPTPLSA